MRNLVIGVACGVVTMVLVFLGVQLITGTGIFKKPGEVYFSESVTEAEQQLFLEAFAAEDVELEKDVYFDAYETLDISNLAANEIVMEIMVPTGDFYGPERDIILEGVMDEYLKASGTTLVSARELDFTRRVWTINGEYYPETLAKGAIFRVIKIDSENYEADVAPNLAKMTLPTWPSKDTVLSFVQTGVTALSRGMNKKLWDEGGAYYFSEKIAPYLSQFDLTHTSNEASFSEDASARNICSDPEFINTLTAIGLDIVELTGNHNQDCGDAAARDTIDIYAKKNIAIVGGGKTAEAAAEPLEINQKNTHITMLAYNESTGGATLDATPGANQYDEADAAAEIAEAKKRGDFVIVDVQYYECSMYVSETEDTTCDAADSAAGDQVGFFRHLIDLGADVVVGTSAHQPQTYELYGEGVIYYGLGNLFFDQVWWPGTTRSLTLAHYFYNGRLVQTRLMPTEYDENMQTALMDAEKAAWYLDRLVQARP